MIGIIGAGAVGSVFAELLYQRYGSNVSALADGERIGRIQSCGGIKINGKTAEFPIIPFHQADYPLDVLLVSVKGYHLEKALTEAERCIGEKTQIISLINGITPVETLAKRYGTERVPLAFTVGQDSVRRGYEINCKNEGKIVMGEHTVPSASPRVEALQALFHDAEITCEIPYDMKHALWWKFMINVGINQVSAVLDAPYGSFQRSGIPREIMISAIREVQEIAHFEGIDLTDEDVEKWLDLLESLNPEGETSMLQDFRAGREMEVDLFAGTMLSLGEKHGVYLPVNAELYLELTERRETTWSPLTDY